MVKLTLVTVTLGWWWYSDTMIDSDTDDIDNTKKCHLLPYYDTVLFLSFF